MRLDGVGKRYGLRQPWIVRDVCMDLQAGRLVRLEGRNGTGKSTLLRIIAGVSVPSTGKVTGRPGTSYVPERFPPALPFSAREYLAHLGRVQGLRGPALSARISQCLEQVGGSEYADVPLRNLSKGMCQKVAVAQALLPRPRLLVLDEAWTGLDSAARGTLDGEVASRLADGGTVVFVDHDPRRLAALPHERWQISQGRVTALGPGSARSAPQPGSARPAPQPGSAQPAPQPGSARPAPRGLPGAAPSAVGIEVSGYPRDAPPPAGLAGVLSARWDGDSMLVQADPSASDDILRALLAAGDQVHVSAVHEQAAGER